MEEIIRKITENQLCTVEDHICGGYVRQLDGTWAECEIYAEQIRLASEQGWAV